MADAFWAFSLDVYGRPGMSATCIALQDGYGADVDMVLFALWCASRGHRLTDGELAAVDTAVAPWREAVVRPLRAARRALKPPPAGFAAAETDALRKQVLAAELEAERCQQGLMALHVPPPGNEPPGPAARDNLAALARLSAIPADAPELAALARAVA